MARAWYIKALRRTPLGCRLHETVKHRRGRHRVMGAVVASAMMADLAMPATTPYFSFALVSLSIGAALMAEIRKAGFSS